MKNIFKKIIIIIPNTILLNYYYYNNLALVYTSIEIKYFLKQLTFFWMNLINFIY